MPISSRWRPPAAMPPDSRIARAEPDHRDYRADDHEQDQTQNPRGYGELAAPVALDLLADLGEAPLPVARPGHPRAWRWAQPAQLERHYMLAISRSTRSS